MNIEQFVNLIIEHLDDRCIGGSAETEMVNDGDDEMESIKMVDGRRESVDRWKVDEWK